VELFAWALRQTRAYGLPLAILASLSVVEVLLRVLLPWPMQAAVDNALGNGQAPGWLAWIPGATRSAPSAC
jgi:hypothetical protein